MKKIVCFVVVGILLNVAFLNKVFSVTIDNNNLEKNTLDFLSCLYNERSKAISGELGEEMSLNYYSDEASNLKAHELNRIQFYRTWIKQFGGTIYWMRSYLKPITGTFAEISPGTYTISVHETIMFTWKREIKGESDIDSKIKQLMALFESTKDPFLKETIKYKIEEIKKEDKEPLTDILSGIGVDHTLMLRRDGDTWKVVEDKYDEGDDLTHSPDFDKSNGLKITNDTAPLVNTTNSNYYPTYYPTATYNPDSAFNYANQCVFNNYYTTHIDDYVGCDSYNLNYVDYNPTGSGSSYDWIAEKEKQIGIPYVGGGDCVNFVSQCLFTGGERMIKNSSNTSLGWYYDNKGTIITTFSNPNWMDLNWLRDDSSSTSWRYLPSLVNFITSYYRGSIGDLQYVTKGDLVYFYTSEEGHIMIVYRGLQGDTLLISAHNNDRYQCPMSCSYLKSLGYHGIFVNHSYPLYTNSDEDFFYPTNAPIMRACDAP